MGRYACTWLAAPEYVPILASRMKLKAKDGHPNGSHVIRNNSNNEPSVKMIVTVVKVIMEE